MGASIFNEFNVSTSLKFIINDRRCFLLVLKQLQVAVMTEKEEKKRIDCIRRINIQ